MEDSAEIKVEASTSKASWIQSHVAASGKRVGRALSYITGEMKECGEGLKGKSTLPLTCRCHPSQQVQSHGP